MVAVIRKTKDEEADACELSLLSLVVQECLSVREDGVNRGSLPIERFAVLANRDYWWKKHDDEGEKERHQRDAGRRVVTMVGFLCRRAVVVLHGVYYFAPLSPWPLGLLAVSTVIWQTSFVKRYAS